MEGTLIAMRREMSRTRTGRASTALLEAITVEYYGAKTPLNQVATLSAPEPRLLVIQPYDRSVINEIERAILQSDLGLVPQNDGKIIRVPDSRAHRGAPPGSGQARPQGRGGVSRVGAQPSARRQRAAQGAAEGRRASPRTSCTAARRRRRSSPRSSPSAWTRCSRPKKTRSWRCEPVRDARHLRARPDPSAAARRGHHGRQRPLGAAPRSVAHRRPPARQGVGARRRRDGPRASAFRTSACSPSRPRTGSGRAARSTR